MTRVLPLPAPASTSTGPEVAVTASRCGGLSEWRMLSAVTAGPGMGPYHTIGDHPGRDGDATSTTTLRVGDGRADVAERGLAISRHGEIAERHDAHHRPSLLHHGEATNRLLANDAHGVAQTRRRRDRGQVAAADLPDGHPR